MVEGRVRVQGRGREVRGERGGGGVVGVVEGGRREGDGR